jgi:hypothetical protein
MNPNQDPNVIDPNLNTAVGASEYLDQISAQSKGKKFLDKKMMIILGALLVVIIVVVIVVIVNSGKKTVDVSSLILKAKTQYDNTMVILKDGAGNLNSGPVARNNAIARLVVGTHTAELTAKVGKSKLSKETAASLRDTKKAQGELKTAREAGRLDSELKETAGLFIGDTIETLSAITRAETTKENEEMANRYIDELETVKYRLENSN